MNKYYMGILIVFLYGCNENNDKESTTIDSTGALGSCFHSYREPVMKIIGASEHNTNSNVELIEIKNINFNEQPVEFEESHNELAVNVEIDYQNNSLVCSLPCAFLQEEGQYEFTITANGYENKTVQMQAFYSIFEGGCPSYSDGGTELYFELTKDS